MWLRSPSDVGGLIRERRRRLGLDQRELARRVGVSRQWIVEIEGGKARAPIELVLRTLEALGVVLKVEELDSAASEVIVEAPDIDSIVRNARKKAR